MVRAFRIFLKIFKDCFVQHFMGTCLGCNKDLGELEGYEDLDGEYCKDCYPEREIILKLKEKMDDKKEDLIEKEEKDGEKEEKEVSKKQLKKIKLNYLRQEKKIK
jgi:hypothetical protein